MADITSTVSIVASITGALVILFVVVEFYLRRFRQRRGTISTFLGAESVLVEHLLIAKKDIGILGVTLQSFFANSHSLLFRSLVEAGLRGVHIRILLFNPQSARDASGTNDSLYTDSNYHYRKDELNNTINVCYELIHKYEELNIDLRIYSQYTPSFIMFIDDFLCISQRGHRQREYQITTSLASYNEHRKVFEKIWDDGKTKDLQISRE